MYEQTMITQKVFKGDYKSAFECYETFLGRKPTVLDYHFLYQQCEAHLLMGDIFFPYSYLLDGRYDCTFDEMSVFEDFVSKWIELDKIFNEYVSKIEPLTDMSVYIKNQNELNKLLCNQFNEMMKGKQEQLPELDSLNKLTEGNNPVLRKWIGGKYKCISLEKFIKAYIKISDNLTPALIQDYLISEKTKEPYRPESIEKGITLYGPGRK